MTEVDDVKELKENKILRIKLESVVYLQSKLYLMLQVSIFLLYTKNGRG